MTEKEARKVINIMLSVEIDDYCHITAAQIINAFYLIFPEFTEIAKDMYREEFNKSLIDVMSCMNFYPTRWIPNRWR